MTERHFDVELRKLKEMLISMAGFVEKALECAGQAIERRDALLIRDVYEAEKSINLNHMKVDTACVTLLALQQPIAADLRWIVAVIKMNTDLERMGDQSVNIAHSLEHLIAHPEFKTPKDISTLFQEARFMVRQSLDAFVNQSPALAKDVLVRDDSVDALKNGIFKSAVELMKASPHEIDPLLSTILIARNLERIGDHATNIAEDVIFATTGDDVRHHGNPNSMKAVFKVKGSE